MTPENAAQRWNETESEAERTLVYQAEDRFRSCGPWPHPPGLFFNAETHEAVLTWVNELRTREPAASLLGHVRRVTVGPLRKRGIERAFGVGRGVAGRARLRGSTGFLQIRDLERQIVLHELAHLAAWQDDHGPSFRTANVALVRTGMGDAAAEALADCYETQGLTVSRAP